ncbi:NS1 [Squirrel bocaparvovirus]|nr:NS1 [Squirrel bocaparvovirus]
MASTLLEPASIEGLTGFHGPAYTYILKWPRKNWKTEESLMQHMMTSLNLAPLMDDYSMLNEKPDITDAAGHRTYLENYGPKQTYLSVLAQAAHSAAKKEFQIKQSTNQPACSIYVQVELGSTHLHVHLVLAGKGLNKYNAKGWRNILAHYWLSYIKNHIHATTGGREYAVEYAGLTYTLQEELQKCQNSTSDLCTILQYRSRSGQMYACRVEAKEFIANYLLCKNLKYSQKHTPEEITPYNSFFIQHNKTYAITLLNGKYVQPWVRKQWTEDIHVHNSNNSLEPVFSGDPYGTLPKVDQANWQKTIQPGGRMTKREGLMLDCMQRCFDKHLLTYEQLVNEHPDLVVMIESQPGGARLLEQILSMVHIRLCQQYSALSYIKQVYSDFELDPGNKVFKLLNLQGYNPWQTGHWICCVLAKKAGKQNTISFYGPASTGKTNLAKAIVNTVGLYGCVNHLNRNFVFNDCASKLILWWEECTMHTDWVEPAKCLMGGTEFRIDRKHRDSMLLPQTPVIISTNNDIYQVIGGNTISGVHAKPIKDRVVQFNFMKQLESTFGEITTQEVADWLLDCANTFPITLEGFYSTWNLTETPNSFPLNDLCPTHSQDFTLHENGLCLQCGGYLPLSTDCGDLVEEPTVTAPPGNTALLIDLTPSKEKAISDFNLSLLATPESRKRHLDPADSEPATPSTSSATAAPAAPKKKARRELSLEDKVNFLSIYSSQPQDEFERQIYEAGMEHIEKEAQEQEQEQEPQSKKGLTPSEWGELLGVITKHLDENPTVLHCFEDLSEEEIENYTI